MPYAVRLSDLSAMGKSEREGVLKRLTDEAMGKPNGRADAALARVRHYETVYECKSEHLGNRLKSGTIRETAEVSHWLFCLKLLSLSGS